MTLILSLYKITTTPARAINTATRLHSEKNMPHIISIADATRAQRALCGLLGQPEPTFTMPQFVGMLSDEIAALRLHGSDDNQIAAVICDSGIEITAAEIQEYFVDTTELRN